MNIGAWSLSGICNLGSGILIFGFAWKACTSACPCETIPTAVGRRSNLGVANSRLPGQLTEDGPLSMTDPMPNHNAPKPLLVRARKHSSTPGQPPRVVTPLIHRKKRITLRKNPASFESFARLLEISCEETNGCAESEGGDSSIVNPES